MIVVKIELHSAVTKKITEIGRMIIANDGKGQPGKYHYLVDLLRRGSVNKVQRSGKGQCTRRTQEMMKMNIGQNAERMREQKNRLDKYALGQMKIAVVTSRINHISCQ